MLQLEANCLTIATHPIQPVYFDYARVGPWISEAKVSKVLKMYV